MAARAVSSAMLTPSTMVVIAMLAAAFDVPEPCSGVLAAEATVLPAINSVLAKTTAPASRLGL